MKVKPFFVNPLLDLDDSVVHGDGIELIHRLVFPQRVEDFKDMEDRKHMAVYPTLARSCSILLLPSDWLLSGHDWFLSVF
jgi:hypothetical protein